MAVGAGVSTLAHGVHYTILAVGLLGLIALLAPSTPGRRTSAHSQDEHERRGAELRHSMAAVVTGATPTPVLDRPTTAAWTRGSRGLWLPPPLLSTPPGAPLPPAVGPAPLPGRG